MITILDIDWSGHISHVVRYVQANQIKEVLLQHFLGGCFYLFEPGCYWSGDGAYHADECVCTAKVFALERIHFR